MKDLIIVGCSGFGREVAWLVERINKVEPTWNLLGFLDDNKDKIGEIINGFPVLGTTDSVIKYKNTSFVCAVGASKTRKTIIGKLGAVDFATLIDPSVEMSSFVEIGEGTIICAHSIITTNIKVGRHCIVNLDCTIGHDAVLEPFVTLYPSVNVSGNTTLGECTEIGTGTNIIQGKVVGSYSIIGAGSVVVKDIPDKCTAVGIPAKPIKFFEE